MDSRHLGPIILEGGVGGGRMDTTVDVSGSSVPFRLEIDFPARFNETVVAKIDLALDSLKFLDDQARQTIAAAVGHATSSASQLFDLWDAGNADDPGTVDEFVRLLQPTQINLLPDGGIGSLDRIVFAYRLQETLPNEKITVRFREGIGPELDAAPYREFV